MSRSRTQHNILLPPPSSRVSRRACNHKQLPLARAPPGAVAAPTRLPTPPVGLQNGENGENGEGEQTMRRETKSPGSLDPVASKEREANSKPSERSAVPNDGLKVVTVQLTACVEPDSLCLTDVPQLSRISQRASAGAGFAVGLPSGHSEQKHAPWLMQANTQAKVIVVVSCVLFF